MKRTGAFTLIEILIVIIVFSIGILAVFHGLTQSYKNKAYADTQIKSAFLAREGIELMFNLRDANYHKKLPWNCLFKEGQKSAIELNDQLEEINNAYCSDYFTPGMYLKVGIPSNNGEDGGYVYVEKVESSEDEDFESKFDKYQIYSHQGLNGDTGFIYNYEEGEEDDEKIGFARYLVITGVTENLDLISTDNLLKIESHVLYKRFGSTGEKVMETFIGNYEF